MNYNVNDIKKWFKFFNPEHFTDSDVDNFVDDLSRVIGFPEFDWEAGATKLCIIPWDTDYVIKIPFDGEMQWDYDDKEYRFQYFYNGGGDGGWDYCALEDEYFVDKILGTGYEEVFLTTDCITINDWPVYIQQKVDTYNESNAYPSNESMLKIRTESKVRGEVSFPDIWMGIGLENFEGNIKKLDNLLRFLRDNFTDLHPGNIGYFNNQIIILDYAGYDS